MARYNRTLMAWYTFLMLTIPVLYTLENIKSFDYKIGESGKLRTSCQRLFPSVIFQVKRNPLKRKSQRKGLACTDPSIGFLFYPFRYSKQFYDKAPLIKIRTFPNIRIVGGYYPSSFLIASTALRNRATSSDGLAEYSRP